MLARRPLDATAYGLMVVCALLWGVQQVAVKVGAAGVSVVMRGGIRSHQAHCDGLAPNENAARAGRVFAASSPSGRGSP